MEKVYEYAMVRTLVDKEGEYDIPAGSIGIVVEVYGDGEAGEVEIWCDLNYPVDDSWYWSYELEEITGAEKQAIYDRADTPEAIEEIKRRFSPKLKKDPSESED